MHCVTEGIEAGKHFFGNFRIAMPHVRDRDAKILGKCAVPVHANTFWVRAEVPASGQAIPATPADDMSFTTDQFTQFHIVHIAANFNNGADEFMAYDYRGFYRLFGPLIPIEDMNIGATYCGLLDLYQNIVSAHLRHWYIFEP
jgi:hypothetical protein